IQDVLIRYKRMDGYEVCWIPGLDHASIATETKVTQWLDSQHISKQDIGREKFLEYAMQWKERYGGIINDQLKRLGISCDWDRERFTMDKEYSKEVYQAFIDLFNAGLIYKGVRLVNWCPQSQSAISDDEVEYREVQGSLWYFTYPVKNSEEKITIATTRPETMFGDTAVMVHPEDNRYKHLIGKTVILPFVHREIPIIADEYVDPEFGTGIVKVTPAHDPNDYEVGQRHGLEMISVMTEEGFLTNHVPQPFAGLERFEARQLVVEEMKKLGLLVSINEHTHKVGYSQRGQVPIETMLSEQWFISMNELEIEAKKAVENGEILFYSQHWTKTYFHWLDNIRDWCISRQLWWGHRIPVYTCGSCDYQTASLESITKCPQCQSEVRQEESVLDTWASSWLWSYAVHRTEEDKDYYHPTDTLVTAPDIIFFWVARMIMAAKYFRKEIPFK
ncbi:MAG: valine--tRNA ligase, partial [Gammaproteobacteria bacterium]